METASRSLARATAVSVSRLSKGFSLPHERRDSVREHLMHPFAERADEVLPALEDVSVEIGSGEFFGIVGRNGSGKSTLLRCLSGIYRPDSGSIRVEGRVAPFIELGVGFHPEMTARQNALVNAVVLGLSPREARRRLDSIVAFAELEDFADLKLKNLSSGMVVRLAFSVTVQVDADVLLFDEVLAVGDSAFREKCHEHFKGLAESGKTVVLVTHDMKAVERFCARAMLLHQGRVVEVGEPEEVTARYEELNSEGRLEARPAGQALSDPVEPLPGSEGRPHGAAGLRHGGLRRLAEVTWTLAVANFRLRYLQSALGYVWTLLRPLLFFAVLLVVFTHIGRFDEGVAHYPLYLLTAIMLWTFFAEATGNSVGALVRNGALLRKVPVPPLALPLSVVLTALFNLVMNLVAVFAVLLASGIAPRPGWLELPLIVMPIAILATGSSLLVSSLYVRLRDIDDIWQVLRQALFYGSPVFYVAAAYPDAVERLFTSTPIAAAFTQARHALIDASAPSTAEALGGTAWLAVPLGIALGVAVAGGWLFARESPRVAESL
jgi:ABC-type polysaccharide/polyol phosphate transport system ATPase subunit/ABC-type polysaccharide/polyol phosphate export permease